MLSFPPSTPSSLPSVLEFVLEFVLSLNDASAPFPGGVRPLDEDPALSFLATIDAGVGSNPGGEFDAPENDAFLLTSGIELNDGSAASSDARPLDRRLAPSSPFCVTSEFLFAFPRVARPLDADDFPCARASARVSHRDARSRRYRRKRSSRGNVIVRARVVARASSRARAVVARRRAATRSSARARVDRDALYSSRRRARA